MEMFEKAMERGANLFSSGGRLVTEQDYLKEIINYSDIIESASIVRNVDRYGKYNEGMLYVLLLMKDFIDIIRRFLIREEKTDLKNKKSFSPFGRET